MTRLRSVLAASLLSAAFGCAEEGDTHTEQAAANTPLTGAIFTTTSDGTHVNANNYDEMCDVYLNGGPGPNGSAALPAGDYYFQVTDPSGMTLLSTDGVGARQLAVDATGRFTGVSGAGDHMTSENLVDGGEAVQLCPFLPTPNQGCVFKVWLTPVGSYDLTAPNGNFGFTEPQSKTDNFRVCEDVVLMPPDAGMPPEEETPDAGTPPCNPADDSSCPVDESSSPAAE